MTKRPTPTSFGFRCSPKTRDLETGCGRALVIIGAIIIIIYIVALALFLARVFGRWPDWALEAELMFREAWKAWMR